MGKIAVVDLSWIMHRYRYAYDNFSCRRDGKRIPTRHIYGAYIFVRNLSLKYKKVILAVDSNPTLRKEILPSYKANRVKEEKDGFTDYNIHKDLDDVLKICTSFENVYYVKEDGYEADDIIGTLIRKADSDWDFYFHDDDILQNIGEYNLCVSYGKELIIGEVFDRREHIKEKYELDLDYLPLLWKVIRGDSGDCIPIGVERFPAKILKELCKNEKLNDNDVTFETCIQILKSYNYSGKMGEIMKGLNDPESSLYKKLEINYKLVKPMYLPVIKRKKNPGNLFQILKRYDIQPKD